jgi:hypothetical protein
MARQRDYAAEYARRRERAAELAGPGVSFRDALRIARGHPTPGQPGLRTLREEARAAGLAPGVYLGRSNRRAAVRAATGKRIPNRAINVYGETGVIINTRTQSHAYAVLVAAADQGKSISLFGQRTGGKDVAITTGSRVLPARVVLDVLQEGLDSSEDHDGTQLGPRTLWLAMGTYGYPEPPPEVDAATIDIPEGLEPLIESK